MLQIVVLGSAAGGGFPQWNCNSEACRNARAGDALARTQSSIAVSGDGRHWFLFNASPDLRQQINATPQLHPNHGLRTSPIAGVVLTNADVDHVAGLLTLRESTPLVLYATERVLATLKANSIFNALNPEFVERRPLVLGRTFEPVTPAGEKAGLAVEAFPVPGKVALYLENPDAGPNFGTQEGDTVGVKVTSLEDGSHFFYIPGCAKMTPDLADRLRGAPLALFDGTLWKDDEMIAAGIGVKTGQRMGHMSMSGEDGTMAAFRDLHVERRVFIHINNSNPTLLDLTPERREVEAQGWEISFDGMEITL
ncbi:MAG: pyrroloquinoline quinone biosynthesis protein PqqB [Proteobacteria bacterium]|nr:pyrroloquinoline quinone biosynthesis protein PqqB [Pseudomonadota bacterium]